MSSIITFSSVSKSYGDFSALSEVSFDIHEGDFFALLGPNGAGKTTLISILTGLQKATRGEVTVAGLNVEKDYQSARRMIGAVPQELVFDPFFTVREALVFQSGYYGLRHNDDWIDELLTSLHLTDKANTNCRRLSGGMKRRLMVAQALVHKPPVIVLDEPTAGVDVELRQALWAFIRSLNKKGHTVLLTTHYLQEAEELSNQIAMMKSGKILSISDKDTLMRSGAGEVLRLRSSLDLSALRALLRPLLGEGVNINTEGGWHTIVIARTHCYEMVEKILHALRANNATITEMQIAPANLEEVFLQTMRKAG